MVELIRNRWERWCVFYFISNQFLDQMMPQMLLPWLSAICIRPLFSLVLKSSKVYVMYQDKMPFHSINATREKEKNDDCQCTRNSRSTASRLYYCSCRWLWYSYIYPFHDIKSSW